MEMAGTPIDLWPLNLEGTPRDMLPPRPSPPPPPKAVALVEFQDTDRFELLVSQAGRADESPDGSVLSPPPPCFHLVKNMF